MSIIWWPFSEQLSVIGQLVKQMKSIIENFQNQKDNNLKKNGALKKINLLCETLGSSIYFIQR